MSWLNPMNWFSASCAYVKQHFVAWQISDAVTWIQAGLLSFFVPTWAQDLWAKAPGWYDQALMFGRALVDVLVELFHNTS